MLTPQEFVKNSYELHYHRAIRSLLKVNRREHIPLRDMFYSARILQIKDIYNYELAKHM